MVLKELIFNSFYCGRVWWFSENSFLTVSTVGGCGGLQRTLFLTVSTVGRVWWS